MIYDINDEEENDRDTGGSAGNMSSFYQEESRRKFKPKKASQYD